MRIGVISDTHAHVHNTRSAVRMLESLDVEAVLHCGDICSTEIPPLLAAWPTHFVYGNCDHKQALSLQQAVHGIGETLHRPFGQVEVEGKKIAFVHGDDTAFLEELENSGEFDFLFYGHTHKAEEHRTGRTRVINPGALHRANPKTLILLDLPAGDVERIEVG